jgi:gamma-glutamyltranspeptidase/glutathione hydrolase
VIRGAAAAASDPIAAEAAQASLLAAASAADALIAGFLAAAGAHPGVLLAPAVALAAGAGVGARVFDGRAVQPGRGARRPRGFVDAEGVPDAARVAVPRSLSMLVLLHGYLGRARLRDLARTGVAAADRAGARARALLLRRFGASGAIALRARDVERALLAAAGHVAGGLLTAEDLSEAMPGETEALAGNVDGVEALRAPWPAGAEARPAEVIVACDGRGVIAALAYTPAAEGVAVPELELTLARDAVPVRRGIPRLAPGTPLPAATPIAILRTAAQEVAIGMPGAAVMDADALRKIAGALFSLPGRDAAPLTGACTVVRDGRDARALT